MHFDKRELKRNWKLSLLFSVPSLCHPFVKVCESCRANEGQSRYRVFENATSEPSSSCFSFRLTENMRRLSEYSEYTETSKNPTIKAQLAYTAFLSHLFVHNAANRLQILSFVCLVLTAWTSLCCLCHFCSNDTNVFVF